MAKNKKYIKIKNYIRDSEKTKWNFTIAKIKQWIIVRRWLYGQNRNNRRNSGSFYKTIIYNYAEQLGVEIEITKKEGN